MNTTINETMAALTWWDNQPKNKRNSMTGLLYGIRIMISDEMIIEMHRIFSK